MTPLEQLKAARELISEPERWTQGATARTSGGDAVMANSTDACCFCPVGALIHVTGYIGWSKTANLLDEAVWFDDCNIESFNDTHTHAEVLAAFDKAIASLEAA